ncbi:L-seryl-tRNA(Sec) selenium transferase [Candidatus Magnetobacterium casense]|uniref:L-seryl-tRNA(Sec) selenium transferase n=1 Tax=Candidatus Magnetobacterium casense TaxID=1455061 RepID=A0ABS6RWK6_9BACT|nr:L-seryl-tRNA(Sec) selenium transferase [Candidatus Magnetobacterium casensis]MBV6341012.1 L-seryl-tRNA(Sec) selenium transferase [Candidatus Magnetobacterium casensis]
MDINNTLRLIPSVDNLLKMPQAHGWLRVYRRRLVVRAIGDILDARRGDILQGGTPDISPECILSDVADKLAAITNCQLKPVINATGIVIHTNLGRAPLCADVLNNVVAVSEGYSNLEYDLDAGSRGKRYVHVHQHLLELTTAEDAMVVNNNAAAVFLSLSALAKGKEVIVSRGELVEIGGSFRVPEIMAQSGCILREVGTTNKTHLADYEDALTQDTALILKVHKSNFRVTGFTEEVDVEVLSGLARRRGVGIMYDLGSGCLVDLRPLGVHTEPSVAEIIQKGVGVVTFSGDKLLGGPQSGVIVGETRYVERLRQHPLSRAVRIDKLTLAALEATLIQYLGTPEAAIENIPVLRMLFQPLETIRSRADRLASSLKGMTEAEVEVAGDVSQVGGGALPGLELPTCVLRVRPLSMTVQQLQRRLSRATPPVVGRIKDNHLLLDLRTIKDSEIEYVSNALETQAGLRS